MFRNGVRERQASAGGSSNFHLAIPLDTDELLSSRSTCQLTRMLAGLKAPCPVCDALRCGAPAPKAFSALCQTSLTEI